MSEKLQISKASYEGEPYAHQEMVQFNDGQLGLLFKTEGDRVPLGADSMHKYAGVGYDPTAMAMIKTKSGSTYGFVDGLVIKKDSRGELSGYEMPDGVDITIGKPCDIPGVASTSDVESVMLRYKIDPETDSSKYGYINRPNPFDALQKIAQTASSTRQ